MRSLFLIVSLAAFASAQGVSETVKVSDFGFDPSDSTEFIKKALASGAKKVILDKQAGPWYTLPLKMPSNIEFILEPSVELVAKRGEFRGKRDYLLELPAVTNVILRGGEGSTLRMWKSDYQKPPYVHSEWRYALRIAKGCKNILVENLRMVQSGGDGIGVSGTDITIRNCVCDDNHRQGMSVFSVENLLVENCVFSNTRGTPPQAGVDIEPDRAREILKNVVFRNCVSFGNAGIGFEMYLAQLNSNSQPIDITYENCRSWNNRNDTTVSCRNRTGKAPVSGRVRYVNCAFGPSRNVSVSLSSIPQGGVDVQFVNTVLTNSLGGIAISAGVAEPKQGRPDGIDFGNLTVYGDGKWFRCVSPGTGPVNNITGEVTIVSPNGTRRKEKIDNQWIERNLPVFDGGRPVPETVKLPDPDSVKVCDSCPGELAPTEPFTILNRVPLVFFADKPGPCRFMMRQISVVAGRKLTTKPLYIEPVDGGPRKRIKAPGKESTEVVYNAKRRGFYRIVLPKSNTRLRIDSTSVPLAMDVSDEKATIASMKKQPFQLQFATVGEPFTFVAYGSDFYRFGISMFDAAGKARESSDMVDGMFVAHGEKGDAPGFCKARFSRGSKPNFDHITVRLYGGGGMFFLTPAKSWR